MEFEIRARTFLLLLDCELVLLNFINFTELSLCIKRCRSFPFTYWYDRYDVEVIINKIILTVGRWQR